jgi:DNA-binding LacI/PurR family transcriptional regulator
LGHTDIAFLGEPPRNPFGFVASANREAGYRQAMARAGLEVKPSMVRYGAFLHSAARTMATDLLTMTDAPTAVVAASDVQAFGVLDAAEQLGMKVPDDVSVIGYDDIDLATQMGLSTVRQPLFTSGERAAELVVQAVAMGHAHPTVEQLEVELVVRRTSARPALTRRTHA